MQESAKTVAIDRTCKCLSMQVIIDDGREQKYLPNYHFLSHATSLVVNKIFFLICRLYALQHTMYHLYKCEVLFQFIGVNLVTNTDHHPE